MRGHVATGPDRIIKIVGVVGSRLATALEVDAELVIVDAMRQADADFV